MILPRLVRCLDFTTMVPNLNIIGAMKANNVMYISMDIVANLQHLATLYFGEIKPLFFTTVGPAQAEGEPLIGPMNRLKISTYCLQPRLLKYRVHSRLSTVLLAT